MLTPLMLPMLCVCADVANAVPVATVYIFNQPEVFRTALANVSSVWLLLHSLPGRVWSHSDALCVDVPARPPTAEVRGVHEAPGRGGRLG